MSIPSNHFPTGVLPFPTPTSSSRESIMNRSKVQLWVPHQPPHSKTFLWKSLKYKPFPPFPPFPLAKVCRQTPLSSTRQNTVSTFYNTSTVKTHTSNSQWNPHNKTHSPSWTLSSPFNQTTPSAPQCIGNPPTQINTYTGTATTTSQQNKVSPTPWHIGPKQYLQLKPAWTRN